MGSFPLIPIPSPGGTAPYIQTCRIALRTDPDITARRILDRRHRLAADAAGRHFLGVDAAEPLPPVRPPRSLVLLRALDPVRQRNILDVVVGPELVLVRRWRIDHAGDVT